MVYDHICLVIWDNWRMVHAVEGCDAKYERQTLRTTIKGDYGLGYFEDGKKIGEVYTVSGMEQYRLRQERSDNGIESRNYSPA